MPCPVKETTNEKTSFIQARANSPRSLASLDRPKKLRSETTRHTDPTFACVLTRESIADFPGDVVSAFPLCWGFPRPGVKVSIRRKPAAPPQSHRAEMSPKLL